MFQIQKNYTYEYHGNVEYATKHNKKVQDVPKVFKVVLKESKIFVK